MAARIRNLIPRFSLRTLIIFIMLAGCASALWLHWEPWNQASTMVALSGRVTYLKYVRDGRIEIGRHDDVAPRYIYDTGTLERVGVSDVAPELQEHRIGAGPGSIFYFPDGRRYLYVSLTAEIWDSDVDELLGEVVAPPFEACAISPNGNEVAMSWSRSAAGGEYVDPHSWVTVYRRRRPEWWWGVFYLPELWATALFSALLIWSVIRDRRTLSPKPPAPS